MANNQFMWQGKLFHRLPGTTLFVAADKIIVPCPSGDRGHSHFGFLAVDEEVVPYLMMHELPTDARNN